MSFSRVFFYLFLAYIAFLLIQHVVAVQMEARETKQEHSISPSAAAPPPIEPIKAALKSGLQSFKSGAFDAAETQFLRGKAIALKAENQEYSNHFTVMLGNLYLESGQLDKAEALLAEAEKQPGMDPISLANQRVVLYEKQGKHSEMCSSLRDLKQMLSASHCDAHHGDVETLIAQKDEAKIVEIFKKPDIGEIVDCAGARMVENKLQAGGC